MKMNESHTNLAASVMACVWADRTRLADGWHDFCPPPPPPPPHPKSLILNELRQVISYYLIGFYLSIPFLGISLQNKSREEPITLGAVFWGAGEEV